MRQTLNQAINAMSLEHPMPAARLPLKRINQRASQIKNQRTNLVTRNLTAAVGLQRFQILPVQVNLRDLDNC